MFSGNKETLQHQDAFELYYSLGAERSYEKVATEFGVSKGTIANWGKAFNWPDRIKLRDIEIAKGLKEKTVEAIITEKANYRKIIRAGIFKFAEQLKEDNIRLESIADLERLIKLDLLLMGENPFTEESKEIVIKIEGI